MTKEELMKLQDHQLLVLILLELQKIREELKKGKKWVKA